MLVFIIPLKHPECSSTNSWQRYSQLFARCVKSVVSQTSPDFRVIVVCNQKPQIEFEHPYLNYIEVNFPPPQDKVELKMIDKKAKVRVGLYYAQEFNPSHTMSVDSDDCLSNRLAEYVSRNSDGDGWVINQGYVYREGANWLILTRNKFHKWCGTCNIVKFGLYELPTRLDYDYFSDNENNLKTYWTRHDRLKEEMEARGKSIKPLPFPGAIYTIENGENYYENQIQNYTHRGTLSFLKKAVLNYRLMTNSIRNEFCLYPLN